MFMARSVIAEVEAEFGQPFIDVVRGFAADNYACSTTAIILGYKHQTALRYYLKRNNLHVDWPAFGKCNAHQNRAPITEVTRQKLSKAKLERQPTLPKEYEARTGESVEALIERTRRTHTVTDVAKMLGYCHSTPFRAWMKRHGINAEFMKAPTNLPTGMGLQSKRCRLETEITLQHLRRRESTHHAAQNTL
jgi:AraC-like DNA-binding protein